MRMPGLSSQLLLTAALADVGRGELVVRSWLPLKIRHLVDRAPPAGWMELTQWWKELGSSWHLWDLSDLVVRFATDPGVTPHLRPLSIIVLFVLPSVSSMPVF